MNSKSFRQKKKKITPNTKTKQHSIKHKT